jgi:hypothetical protein
MCLKRMWKKKGTVRIKIEVEFVFKRMWIYKEKSNCNDQNIEFWSKRAM